MGGRFPGDGDIDRRPRNGGSCRGIDPGGQASPSYPGITDTAHLLNIIVLGKKQAASSGTFVTVGFLAIFV